ncbi:integrase [Bifidobacterium pseudocatenulatum]|jgi:integrase/recombinase XerD|nr:integrase [Bifidobacterium pseudocatenulatum]
MVPSQRRGGLWRREGLRIHSLRHTYASFAIGAGCDVKTLQSIMGHASATETLNTYAELWPDRIDEVAAVMEAKYQQWETQRRE